MTRRSLFASVLALLPCMPRSLFELKLRLQLLGSGISLGAPQPLDFDRGRKALSARKLLWDGEKIVEVPDYAMRLHAIRAWYRVQAIRGHPSYPVGDDYIDELVAADITKDCPDMRGSVLAVLKCRVKELDDRFRPTPIELNSGLKLKIERLTGRKIVQA